MSHPRSTRRYRGAPPLERFLAYVKPVESGCHEWQSTVKKGRKSGYGQFWLEGKSIRAHRAAWLLQNGPIPDDRLVLHTCDNRKCVRLDHLYLGDAMQNAKDRAERDRDVLNGVKATPRMIAEIRQLYAAGGHTQMALADRFGLKQPTISEIVRGDVHHSRLIGA